MTNTKDNSLSDGVEKRLDEIFPTWFKKHGITFSGELPLYGDDKPQILAMPYNTFNHVHKLLNEARIAELAAIPFEPNGLPNYIEDRIKALQGENNG